MKSQAEQELERQQTEYSISLKSLSLTMDRLYDRLMPVLLEKRVKALEEQHKKDQETIKSLQTREAWIRRETGPAYRPVSSFLTRGYNIAVRARCKPFERRQKKRFSPARLISAMRCRCSPQVA